MIGVESSSPGIPHSHDQYIADISNATGETVEKEMITRTIEFTAGNKTRAADILGVSERFRGFLRPLTDKLLKTPHPLGRRIYRSRQRVHILEQSIARFRAENAQPQRTRVQDISQIVRKP